MSTIQELRYWITMHNGRPENIESICCDMSRAYISGIREAFPSAMLVFDRFHVMGLATSMVEDVRRSSGLKSSKGRTIRFKLLKNRSNLGSADESMIIDVLRGYEDLGWAYMIKEALGGFYLLKDVDTAKAYLHQLILFARNTNVERIVKFADSIEDHFDGIVRWVSEGMTNGIIEGNNSVLQAMKAGARGYSNPESMVTMFYIKTARGHPSLSNYTQS